MWLGIKVFKGNAFFDYCVVTVLVEGFWFGEDDAVARGGIRTLIYRQQNQR